MTVSAAGGPHSDVGEPVVTVIVPARNEEASIGACLRRIQGQSFTDIEVLVIDGMSEDRTRDVVEELRKSDQRITILDNRDRVIPNALNVGLIHARGKYLVRVDAHAIPAVDYVERIVAHLETGEYAGVGGVKIAAGGRGQRGQAIAGALSSRFGVGGSSYHYATSAMETDHIPFGAYRVDLLRALGGWDQRLLVNQDFELDYRIGRAGGRLLLDPSIRVWWKASQSVSDLRHQYRRYGKGKALVACIHPRSLKFRHLLPPIAVLCIALSVATSVVLFTVWPLAVGVLYVASLLAAPIADRRLRPTPLAAVIAPIILATMHLAWGVGFL